MDTSKYKALYLQETHDHLRGIESGLLELEKDAQPSVIDNLFRHYHSIKGMSASMGYVPVMKLAHAQEELLDRIRQKKLELSSPIVTALLKCLDALKNLVMRVEEDLSLEVDVTHFTEMIKAAIEGRQPAEEPGAEGAGQTQAAAREEQQLKLSHVMKVEGRVFDDLLATVGDLFMVLSSFKTLSHNSRSVAFKDGIYMLGRSVNSLHDNILSARMLPISDLTVGLPRVIRDICKTSGKEVELKIEGADIRLDRAILEGLGSAIVHIIRNAVDHGIEATEVRNGAGKQPKGLITIRAYGKKDKVILEVSDDGGGVNLERIKKKALEKGTSAEKLRSMSDKEALMLICMPGLSGAEKVTDVSGRGVGMDVVRDITEGLGGSLDIESEQGKGTKMILELPKTTSITKALLVTVGEELFLLPISKIEKVLEVAGAEISGGTLAFGDVDIPVISLGAALGMEERGERPTYTVVVVENSRQRDIPGTGARSLAGIRVDDFGDEMDAYIKPLLPPISRLWGVLGITIMGDGRPVFLLDLPQIISKNLQDS